MRLASCHACEDYLEEVEAGPTPNVGGAISQVGSHTVNRTKGTELVHPLHHCTFFLTADTTSYIKFLTPRLPKTVSENKPFLAWVAFARVISATATRRVTKTNYFAE